MSGAQKTGAAGVAGALTVIIVWGVGLAGVEVPPEVASAFTTLIAGVAVWKTKNKEA